ncbi:hypothetical protein ACIOEX_03335 [Streptomyces sp. NPDC087850]|uniref:hypothetical protein n=1 Tax=Streptomyces sp. NPDC087850 TaxID=3365809 RepID=UPI0038136822
MTLIARALTWVLRLLLPAHGNHRALAATTPEPAPANPWLKPWTAPGAEEVRAIFRAEETMRLTPVRRERCYAAGFATHGIDYPYTGHGVHQVRTGATA